MKHNNSHTTFYSLLLVLFSTSLMVSTLHSHKHIEWHHPKKHTDTGHCLTVDSTVCPICAYLVSGDLNPSANAEMLFTDFEILQEQANQNRVESYNPSLPGRSPPFFV